jgi:transposase
VPDAVVDAEELDSCTECGAELGPPVHNRERVVEELPDVQPVRTVLYREFHYLCRECGSEIVARHPECPPCGRFGKNVYIQTTLLKFAQRLPLGKVCSVLEREGLEITEPTALALLDRANSWLKPEYERVLELIRGSDVVHTDQTGIKVDGVNHWIWTFTAESETLYAIRPSKGKRVLQEILGKDWNGTLVCDGSQSHHAYARESGARVQRCWAHSIREAEGLERYREGRVLSGALRRLYRRLEQALADRPPPRERKRLLRNARRTLRRWLSRRYRNAKVRKFAQKLECGFEYWFTFVLDPRVPPTNNAAERALRELVVQRKIIGTLRNDRGVRIYETLPTLLETWKQRGLNLWKALSSALVKAWQNGRWA